MEPTSERTQTQRNSAKQISTAVKASRLNRETPVTGYRKPIYILMDGACGSSCEMAITAFEWHKHAVTVGENTEGTIHFSNAGYLILPHSRIEVQIPTQYSEFYDRRFIERVGIAPTVRVPSGEDAYDAVKRIVGRR